MSSSSGEEVTPCMQCCSQWNSTQLYKTLTGSRTWVSPVSSLLYCMMPIYPWSMTALPRDKSPVWGSGPDWSLGLDPVKPAEAGQARGEISLNETESEELCPAPAKTGDPTATGLVPSFLYYSQHSTEPQKIQVTRATENRNGILSGLPQGPRPSSLSSLSSLAQ